MRMPGRRRGDAPRRGPLTGGNETVEEALDGDWVVRRLTGSATSKTYRCPGCDHEIRPAVPHVVAWRIGDEDDRRHWHTPCWDARDRRHTRGATR
jgi:hypothetical protein